MTSVQALRSACDFWRPVHLNEDDSLSLEQITNSFSAPITEEHAFAIIYECCKTLKNVFQGQRSKCAVSVVSSLRDIFLHRDGRVHETTFRAPKSRPRRDSVDRNLDYSRAITDSEEKVITELGLVIYSALDFGLKENEERTLTPGLENLLDLMTSFATESDEDEEDDDDDEDVHGESDKSDPLLHESQAPDLLHPRLHRHDTDDEGIEKDHDDSDHFDGHFSSASSSGSSNDRSCYFSGPSSTSASSSATTSPPPLSTTRQSTTPSPSCRGHAIDQVLCRCANHLSVRSEADAHFRAVCRALVSEALELSSFLEKGRFSVTHSEELQDLALQDWANLWIQTLSELRQGVKLKKTDYTKTPIEFELTPYEILMDDIRSRRYKLNKVMVDGEIPHRIKKDAHDIILEFIRSRPPLKPASQRKLQPCQTYVTPQERLMQEIRSKDPKEFLRKTPGPRQAPKPIQMERSYVGTSIKVHVNGPITNTYPASRSSLNHAKSMSSLSWANCNVNGSRNISSHHSTINIRRSDEHNENDKDELQLRSSQCPSPVKKVVRPDPNFMKFDPDDDDEDMGGPFSNPTDQRTRPQRRVQWQSDALDLAVPSSSSRNPLPRRVSLHSTQYHPPSRDSPDHSPVVLRRSNRKTSQSFLHNVSSSPAHLRAASGPSGTRYARAARAKSALILTPPTQTSSMTNLFSLQPQPVTALNPHLPNTDPCCPSCSSSSSISSSSPSSSSFLSSSRWSKLRSTFSSKNNNNNPPNTNKYNPAHQSTSSLAYASMPYHITGRPCSLHHQAGSRGATPLPSNGRQMPELPPLVRASSTSTFCAQTFLTSTPLKRTTSYLSTSSRPAFAPRASFHPDEMSPVTTPLVISGLTRTARKLSSSSPSPVSPSGGDPPSLVSTSNPRYQVPSKSPSLKTQLTAKFTPRRQLPRVPEAATTTSTVKPDKFDQWASALQTLDLTLAEVVHIRSVLTKAELESLTIDTNLREDLEKKKVCFLCMKTRFGLFTWSYECQLCHHTVCSGCLSKMRIPSEHFSNIPVFALSPLPSKEEERENRLFSFSAKRRASSFFPESDLPSATSENDTNSRRKSMSDRVADNNGDIMQSLPANRSESSPRKDSKVKLRRSNTVCHKQKPDLSSSSQVNVCIDCKEMILQIIRTQRATRRQQFTKSLCLS